jgi:hypothetical protein
LATGASPKPHRRLRACAASGPLASAIPN